MPEIIIDPLKCMSIKNKSSQIQCPHLKKNSSDYCGIHSKTKIINRIDTLLNSITINTAINTSNIVADNVSNCVQIVHKNMKILDTDSVVQRDFTQKKVYNMNDILHCNDLNDLTSQNLKQTIVFLKTTDLVPLIDKTKRGMYSHLYNYYQKNMHYLQNMDKVVKTQKIFKKYLQNRRKKCVNDYDLYTIEDKYEIPLSYFIDIMDVNGFFYCFDIRTLSNILANNNPTNPFTQMPITQQAIDKYMCKIDYLKRRGINIGFEQDKVSNDQSFTHRMVDVFHKFDILDNYTDHRWFADLNIKQLKYLYKKCEDIWNYRSQLAHEQKAKIVKDGVAFTLSMEYIQNMRSSQKRQLQDIILNEFERFVIEGQDINEKRLGAMLMLTALVEVSFQAANALPHLIQYI